MSHRFYFFLAGCSRVKIWKPADNLMLSLLGTLIQLELHSNQIPNTMSHSQSINTSLLEVMISSQKEPVFIRDLNGLTLQIICDAWWTSMNVDSKLSIAWNNSRHAPSWRFYLHFGMEEIGSPGIICIVCHQVLHHPSEYGTSSMGKPLLAKVHIAKQIELTVSEVSELTKSTVDETALAILKWQASWRNSLVRSQLTLLFDI